MPHTVVVTGTSGSAETIGIASVRAAAARAKRSDDVASSTLGKVDESSPSQIDVVAFITRALAPSDATRARRVCSTRHRLRVAPRRALVILARIGGVAPRRLLRVPDGGRRRRRHPRHRDRRVHARPQLRPRLARGRRGDLAGSPAADPPRGLGHVHAVTARVPGQEERPGRARVVQRAPRGRRRARDRCLASPVLVPERRPGREGAHTQHDVARVADRLHGRHGGDRA